MADKILPQRVSAFHSSPQPTPPPFAALPPLPPPPPSPPWAASPPPSGAELQRPSHFHCLFKKLIKKWGSLARGRGWGGGKGRSHGGRGGAASWAPGRSGLNSSGSADIKVWDKEGTRARGPKAGRGVEGVEASEVNPSQARCGGLWLRRQVE